MMEVMWMGVGSEGIVGVGVTEGRGVWVGSAVGVAVVVGVVGLGVKAMVVGVDVERRAVSAIAVGVCVAILGAGWTGEQAAVLMRQRNMR
jgi:hypothetical protein